jgi:uncharacterized protein with GYD domain
MWFIRLVRMKDPPTKESMDAVNKVETEAAQWGVKFHWTFFTLGRYDVVNIFEAPDMKTAMRVGIAMSPWTRGSETLEAVSRDEVDSWVKSM